MERLQPLSLKTITKTCYLWALSGLRARWGWDGGQPAIKFKTHNSRTLARAQPAKRKRRRYLTRCDTPPTTSSPPPRKKPNYKPNYRVLCRRQSAVRWRCDRNNLKLRARRREKAFEKQRPDRRGGDWHGVYTVGREWRGVGGAVSKHGLYY